MLTQSQMKTLTFLREFISTKQYSPTTAEIARGIGIQSRGVVYRYLKALQETGYIRLLPNRRRNIELVEHEGLPLLGQVAAGKPLEAIVDQHHIDLNHFLNRDHHFYLKVRGDSMTGAGIFGGDLVICECTNTVTEGEIALALVDGEEVTLKRFHRQGDKVLLRAQNRDYPDMIYRADRVLIQARYIGLLRLSQVLMKPY